MADPLLLPVGRRLDSRLLALTERVGARSGLVYLRK